MKKILMSLAAGLLLFGPIVRSQAQQADPQDPEPYDAQAQDPGEPPPPGAQGTPLPPQGQPAPPVPGQGQTNPNQQPAQIQPGVARLSFIHGDVSQQRGD